MSKQLSRIVGILAAALIGIVAGAAIAPTPTEAVPGSGYFPRTWGSDPLDSFGARSSPLNSSTAESSFGQ